jgi:hypothetical protein
MNPLPAEQALERYFLEARSKLLDLAAILDRIDRGNKSGRMAEDARLQKIRQALELLHDGDPARAERVQKIFSREYDPKWQGKG